MSATYSIWIEPKGESTNPLPSNHTNVCTIFRQAVSAATH